ncbi:hypothetical protein [Chryseolinea lacunae]|uniref:Polysaccharide chain length determinant N-terminal domain-containing protein n=1 Tax=Chryseolinea lacunae TaxID=2801331 RepID=A0ABS1KRV2_9BACT|nr:hypothetical protein [Chryseolinea lacunae]MBL0742200.1 hypothetical protein [Chryseolinea lacunae]
MANGRNDEIDLLDLVLRAVRIIRDNFWMILIFFVLGTALGSMHYFSSVKVYENKMIVSSEIMTESYSKKLIDNINHYLAEGNTKALTSLLGISAETASNVGVVRIESPYSNESEVAKEEDRKYFIITVEVYNQDILPDLQKGLINYFENNAYVKVRVNQKRTGYQETIARYDQEIKDLDGLKKRIYDGDFFNNTKGSVVFDLTSINKELVELTIKRLEVKDKLELVNSVQLLEGFTRFNNPVKPRLSVSIVAGSFVGLIFVSILIAFKSIRKLLRMEEAAREAKR